MGIPVCNKLFVHLMDGLEGSPCIADDIGVREMRVRYEPLIHFATVKILLFSLMIHDFFYQLIDSCAPYLWKVTGSIGISLLCSGNCLGDELQGDFFAIDIFFVIGQVPL